MITTVWWRLSLVRWKFCPYSWELWGIYTIRNNITSFSIIDNILKIYWFKKINIEGDCHPWNVDYYPPLASIEMEMECIIVCNDSYNKDDDDDNDDDDDDDDNWINTECLKYIISFSY